MTKMHVLVPWNNVEAERGAGLGTGRTVVHRLLGQETRTIHFVTGAAARLRVGCERSVCVGSASPAIAQLA